MKSYWLWLLLNMIVWPLAFVYMNLNIDQLTVRVFGVALYFVIFFIIPMVEKKPIIVAYLLYTNIFISTITLFSYDGVFNPYLILILSLLMAEGFYRLPIRYSVITQGFGSLGLIITFLYSNLGPFIQLFIGIYIFFFFIAMLFYKKTKIQLTDLDDRYQAIFSEYRELKRRGITEEELARQEERVLIAHEIHDSVGHKLTALVMQLEMFRIQTSENDKDRVRSLKELAGESLDETRRAVKSLKAHDTGGLPGILRLIRKLEVENLIRIHFSVKHGTFTAPLTGEQSFVIYRSLQEALTNIMKHSHVKEAEILFEAPGRSIFRFEISNPFTETRGYQEGFGLSSMRERLEKFSGDLKVYQTEEQFIVSGYIKLTNTGDAYDSNSIS